MSSEETCSQSVQVRLAEACRIIAHEGLAEDILGHVSLRTGSGIAVRCRGPKEKGLLFTLPEDICEVVAGQEIRSGYRTPNELPIHAEILAERSDVQSVVHAHAPSVVAANLAGIDLAPSIGAYNIPAMRMAANRIPVYERSLLINTDDLGREVAATLGDAPALVLKGHGIVTVGATLEEAVVRALNVEILAKTLLSASARGPVDYVVCEEDMALMPDLGSEFNDVYVWQHQIAKLAYAGLSVA
ncbi:class II aldolase/adducin family protein [Arthrobacter sp. TMS1-12-1]